MLFATLAVAGALMAPAHAHMIMKTPTPFNTPNNSPLDPSGTDYPCRGPGTTMTQNEFKVGSKQTLSFTGTAVHGGGSCQLSVTTDTKPTKDSKFKVIHSIEGGCPGVDGGPATFSFPVPSELPNGNATFAWTWMNKIGNREMYMNCASIFVTGGASDTKAFDTLPDMAVANIAVGTGAKCKTSEGSDYTFEAPGKSVQRIGAGPFAGLCGGAASGGGSTQPSPGAGAGQGAGPGAGPSPAVPNNGQYTPSAKPPAASQAPPATSSPAIFAPGASGPDDALTSTISTLVTVTAPVGAPTGNATLPTKPSESAAPAPAPAPSAGGNAQCATDGEIVCNGETQFGLCDHGKIVWQSVAAGTKCSSGKIVKRDFAHRAQRSSYRV
ncbi:hypothetical protein CC80DRAFT_492444 [Byssothecium circinans]|uniref:Carbohydrate-binding module family 19 domain-containing protein n=1 Tax=Byssothecium circinans TaxID=147558 RepID=A0A6A5TTA1_9PLEO|nr:hypothetical protein CC80DRAFT_492444 [Byssothecium circinans]